MRNIFLLGALLGLLSSCASLDPLLLNESVFNYKADMLITVDGYTFDGVAVTAMGGRKQIDINVVSQVKLDALYVKTCGRFQAFSKVNKNWYGGVGKTFSYSYQPVGSELDTHCPIFFEAYDLTGALAAWGMIAFRDGNELPTAKNGASCNGELWTYSGMTACQTQQGVEQQLLFDVSISSFISSSGCNLKQINDKKFSYRPSLGRCEATFTDGSRKHRLIGIGFKRPLLRE